MVHSLPYSHERSTESAEYWVLPCFVIFLAQYFHLDFVLDYNVDFIKLLFNNPYDSRSPCDVSLTNSKPETSNVVTNFELTSRH